MLGVRGMGSLSEPERREKPAGRGGCRRSAVKKDAEDSGREASVVRVRRTRVRARRDRGVRARARETCSARIVSRASARRRTRRAVNPRGRAMRVHAVCRAFVPAISNARTVIAGRLVAASAWGMVLCVCAVWAVRRALDSSALDAVMRAFGSCERRSTLTGLRVGSVTFERCSRKDPKKKEKKWHFARFFSSFLPDHPRYLSAE